MHLTLPENKVGGFQSHIFLSSPPGSVKSRIVCSAPPILLMSFAGAYGSLLVLMAPSFLVASCSSVAPASLLWFLVVPLVSLVCSGFS